MIVKSFGCSFIWGNELPDIAARNKKYSHLTWPALIADHKQAHYQCHARPGAGNFFIVQSLLNQLHSADDLYIINWTYHGRFDYVFPRAEKITSSWHSILPWDPSERAQYYYRHFHSEFTDKLQNLIWISTAISALQELGAKFCMTYMDSELFDNRWHITPAVAKLQQKVKPHLHQFESLNFVDWSRMYGYPIGAEGNHPLEQAHAAAAEYLINHGLV